MDRLYPSDDFEASIRILTSEEGGRSIAPFNGIRCDFCYAGDNPGDGLWCIHPDFLDSNGESRLRDQPLPVGVPLIARMLIIDDELRQTVHRRRLKPGVRFCCMEGFHRVAEGEVTKITGLFEPRTNSSIVARKMPEGGAPGPAAAIYDTPTDPEVLNPYRRHTKMAYMVFSIIALNCALSLFPDSWVSITVNLLSFVAMCILIYLMARERREVRSRLLRYCGLPGHCIHCGWYQQDKKLKRCSSCSKSLDAKPRP